MRCVEKGPFPRAERGNGDKLLWPLGNLPHVHTAYLASVRRMPCSVAAAKELWMICVPWALT